MKLLCLSASNIEPFKDQSASTRTCELVRDQILVGNPSDVEVEILRLIGYDLKPCRMCGKCFGSGYCVRDEAFNSVFDQMISADRLFIVCPQYATLPAKLVILFEKFQEISYLHWCADNTYQFPLAGKPVGLIAHGGQGDEALQSYKQNLLQPMASILGSVGMRVVGVDDQNPYGVVFGINKLLMPKDSIFVTIEHDWDSIQKRIEPLVIKVMKV